MAACPKTRKRRQVERWRAMTGARPAWMVTLALTVGSFALLQWADLRERVAKAEDGFAWRDRIHRSDVERLEQMIRRRCQACGDKR